MQDDTKQPREVMAKRTAKNSVFVDLFPHGMKQKAVTETIRICKDRNVLQEYLAQREKEVVTIMMSLFDDEQIMKSFIKSERHDEVRETAERMIRMGKLSLEEIALCVLSVSLDELKEIEAEVMQLA